MAKIPPPPGGGVGGCRDGWVVWPQISAFWATRHPPPPGCFLSVYFFSVSFLCHGKPRWGYVLMGPVTVWNRLTPTILVFEYLDPPSWRNWIFSALQTRLTEEPIYVTPPPSPPAHDRLRQDRSRLLSSSPLPPPSPSCCKRARLSTAL